MASLSLFHLRAIFYGANIGIYFITPKKNDDIFSHTAMNFKTISTPAQRKRPLQPPIVRPRTAHLQKRASAREAGEARGGPHGGTERHNRRAARSVRKKEEQTAQALGIFSTYRGAFRRWPPPRPPPTPTQEARSEKPAKKHSRARTHHRVSVFFLHPSAVIRWFTTRYG